jgi:putative endonuclease
MQTERGHWPAPLSGNDLPPHRDFRHNRRAPPVCSGCELWGLTVPRPRAEWWVYVLRCRDGTLYTGVTTDPARRLEQHNAGTASKYTRARRPVTMVYRERTDGHGAALQREFAIKKLSRAAKDALVASRRRRKRA